MADFENLSLATESFNNGSDGAGGFSSGGSQFSNTQTLFNSWLGWSYSNVTDNTTPGFVNQYSAITGSGADGSSNYAVGFAFSPGDARIDLAAGTLPESIAITNSTYAYLDMLSGSAFSKAFGGDTGDDPDFFLLTITGLDASDAVVGAVEFYLADYRFADNSLDYLVDTWTQIDLTSLAGASSLSFAADSSDVGAFGINTPTYFAVDNFTVVPEPATLALVAIGAVVCYRRRRASGRLG